MIVWSMVVNAREKSEYVVEHPHARRGVVLALAVDAVVALHAFSTQELHPLRSNGLTTVQALSEHRARDQLTCSVNRVVGKILSGLLFGAVSRKPVHINSSFMKYIAPLETRINGFLKLAKAKHGGRYSYDKLNYINADTKVVIGCRTHGLYHHVLQDRHQALLPVKETQCFLNSFFDMLTF